MINIQDTLKMLEMINKLKDLYDEEKDTLLSELVCSYISGKDSELMEFLLKGDYKGFQNHIVHMNTEGNKIKVNLKR